MKWRAAGAPASSRAGVTLLHGALDAGAECAQLELDALVAAVDVVDAEDFAVTLRRHRGEDESRAGANVGGHHGRAFELLAAANHGQVAVEADIRAEAAQLGHVGEPVGING